MTEQLRITIWNDKGEIVVDEFQDCETATNEEIAEMVVMIEGGCPAELAARLVKQK